MTRTVARWAVAGVFCIGAALPWSVGNARAGGSPPAVPGRLPTWQVLVPAGSVPHLSQPAGLAIDRHGTSAQKWMYLADAGKNRVIKLGTGGHYLGSWGSQGTAPGQFEQPRGIAVDRHGNLYVADTANNRIQKFGPKGRLLLAWGARGSGPGQFDGLSDVAVGGSGNVFVADRINRRIEKFSPSGRLLAIWPIPIPTGLNPTGYGPPGPFALTVDPAGTIYTAVNTGQCSGGHCVMDYIALETLSPSGTVLRTVVGGNPYGTFSYQSVPGVTSAQGPWWQIGAMGNDSAGHLFLLAWYPQLGASVVKLSAASGLLGHWELPAPNGGWPGQGIALDPRGNVYVSDTPNNRVLKLVFRP